MGPRSRLKLLIFVQIPLLERGFSNKTSKYLARKLPDIEDLVNMATVVSKKVLHEFLLVKCKEQTIEFTKKFNLS